MFNHIPSSRLPLFSGSALNNVYWGLLVSALSLVVSWPTAGLSVLLLKGEIPFNFFVVSSTILTTVCFISIISGTGEISRPESNTVVGTPGVTPEEQNAYLIYGFLRAALRSFLLSLPYTIILMISMILSAISMKTLPGLLLLFVVVALLCRQSAFLVYLLTGRNSFKGYLLNLSWPVLYLVATWFLLPRLNPYFILYRLTFTRTGLLETFPSNRQIFILILLALNTILALTIHGVIKSKRRESLI